MCALTGGLGLPDVPVIASNNLKCALSPVDVVVLMHAVQLQFKATQQVLDHDPKVMVEDPGTEAC